MGDTIKRKPRKQTKDVHTGDSDGADLVKRFGLKGEPKKHDEKMLIFLEALKDETSRPDFDRDKFIRTHNFSKEMIEIIDGMISINKDKKLSSMLSIGEAISDGNLDEAKRLIEEAEMLQGDTNYVTRYQILEYEGKFEEALALCNKSLASKPDLLMIAYKASVLREMGRMQEQLDLFEHWKTHFRDDPDFLAERGRALAAVGRLDEAEKVIIKALELDDEFPVYQFLAMGEIQLARGDHEGAIKLFNRVLDIDENEADAYVGKANALVAMGKHEQAILVCEQFLSRAPIRGRLKRTQDRIRATAQV